MPSRTLQYALVFIAAFIALHIGWEKCRESTIERWVIDTATVTPAAWSVNKLWPENPVVAQKNSLVAQSGRLNILNGCEGLETLFLLIAAFIAYPMRWRSRAIGMLTSTLLIYSLNQIRIVVLWWTIYKKNNLFEIMHGTILPLVLIAIALIFFMTFLSRQASE